MVISDSLRERPVHSSWFDTLDTLMHIAAPAGPGRMMVATLERH